MAGVRAWVVVAGGTALAACAGGRAPERPPPLPPPFVRLGVAQAEALAERGEWVAATGVLRRLALRVPPELRAALHARRRALKAAWASQTLRRRSRLEPKLVFPGQALTLSLTVENRGADPVRIPAADRQGLFFWRRTVGRSLWECRIRLTAVDPRGTRVEERENCFFPLSRPLRLDPGERWTTTLRLSTRRWSRPLALLREVEVAVWLHPVAVEVGSERWLLALPFPPARAYLLPRGAERLQKEPGRALAVALRRAVAEPRFLLHIPVAVVLVPAAERDRARRLLLPLSRRRDPLGRTAARALALLEALSRKEAGP